MKPTLAILALAAAGLAGCADYPDRSASAPAYATSASATTSQCFRTRDMRNHTIADRRTLYVSVGLKEVYRIGMNGDCLAGATSSDPLVIGTAGSSGLVCKAIDLDLGISRGGFTSRCLVGDITRLTPEQVAALPPDLKP